MANVRRATSPGGRVQIGNAVLTAAKSVNTRPVQARLTTFAAAHRTYVAAQRKVDAASATLQDAKAKLAQVDRVQDEAVELLARAVIAEGQSRTNPFASYGGATPAAIMRLPLAEEAQQIQSLVLALQRNASWSPPTQQAIGAANKAAQDVERALVPIADLEAAVQAARAARDALVQTWEAALAGLKRGARAAIDEGEPHLYAALFDHGRRTTARTAKAERTPPAAAEPKPAPAPSSSAA